MKRITDFKKANFVYLDGAKSMKGLNVSYLFSNPKEILVSYKYKDVENILRKISKLSKKKWLAGYITYEASYAFTDEKLAKLANTSETKTPLIWFGVFDHPLEISYEQIFQKEKKRNETKYKASITQSEYFSAINRIKKYIEKVFLYVFCFSRCFILIFSSKLVF